MSKSYQDFDEVTKTRIADILQKISDLQLIDERLKMYSDRIDSGSVKDRAHIQKSEKLSRSFGVLLGAISQVWSKKDMRYAEYNKWTTISKALKAFSVDLDDLLDKDIKISGKDREHSYNGMILDIKSSAANFALTINTELQNAADALLRQAEKQDSRAEIASLMQKLANAEAATKLAEAKTALMATEFEERAALMKLEATQKLNQAKRAESDTEHQVERLEREIARLRPFEVQPDQRQVNTIKLLEAEVASLKKHIADQPGEVVRLKVELAAASEERQQMEAAHKAALENMQTEYLKAAGENTAALQQRIDAYEMKLAETLKRMGGELSDAQAVIADLREATTTLHKENEALKGEGRDGYLQGMFAQEAMTNRELMNVMREKIAGLEKDKQTSRVRLEGTRKAYDTLSAAMNKLLAQAGQPQLPLIQRPAKPNPEDPDLHPAGIAGVKDRLEQANAALDLVVEIVSQRKAAGGRHTFFLTPNKKGEYERVKKPQKVGVGPDSDSSRSASTESSPEGSQKGTPDTSPRKD